jgi:NitT/TauT family transport system permease protein
VNASPAPAAQRWLDFVLLVAVLVAGWQGLHALVGDSALSGPAETFAHLLAQFDRPRFRLHLEESGRAFAAALAIAWLGGVGIGIWLGAARLAGDVAEPLLVALYSLPKVTLYPLVLLVFGLGIEAKIAFGAIHGVAPVAIFAMNAVRNIKPVHLKAARAMRLSPLDAARRVLIPASLPEIVTGLRLGFSLTLLGVVIGEMFASQRGLGFMIVNAIGMADTKTMLAVTLLLFAFAACANGLLLWLDRRLNARV